MIHKIFTFFILITAINWTACQMVVDGTTYYGNEWIQYDQDYIKITVNEDGIYKLDKATLDSYGFPSANIPLENLKLYYLGQEIPLKTTTNGLASSSDYILFFGQRNRSEIDKFLYEDPSKLMNDDISFFTDESSYFLTWNDQVSTARYTEVNNNIVNGEIPQSYFMGHKRVNYYDSWVKKYVKSGFTYLNYAHFEEGEGWAKYTNNGVSESIALPNLYTGEPIDGHIETSVVTLSYGATHVEELRINDMPLDTITITGYQEIKFDEALSSDNLQANMSLGIKQISTDPNVSKIVFLSYYDISYPHTFDMEGKDYFAFNFPSSNTDVYFEFTNFNHGGDAPILFDLSTNQFYPTVLEGNIIKVKVNASAVEHKFVLTSNTFKDVIKLQERNFIDYSTVGDKNYIIITHPALNNADSGTNWVEEYANYRASNIGGGYAPQIINIEQLYDQFAYGIHWHPISIRNFAHYIDTYWPSIAAYFIIGKGSSYIDTRHLASSDENSIEAYIPSWGDPQSDMLLMASNTSTIPIAPIGRIGARTPDKLHIYLDKVKAQEAQLALSQTIENKAWMKRFIHLGGGKTEGEQADFKNYLNGVKNNITNGKLGADVISFFKTSSDPVAVSPREEVTRFVNEGITALTFFGHSSPDLFDFAIDPAPLYDNEGKYPIIFSLGCSAGNIFSQNVGLSEEFLFEEDKGAIGFYASTHYAYVNPLKQFHGRFFEMLNSTMYGATVGEIMKENVTYFENNTSPNLLYLKEELFFHGDPVLRLNVQSTAPDYISDRRSFGTEPSILNTLQDSFYVDFDVYNIGRGLNDSFNIKIQQKLPNGDIFDLKTYRIDAPFNKVAQHIKLPLIKENALGTNRILITLDSQNEIEEEPTLEAESNNVLTDINGNIGLVVHVSDDNINPNWPRKFGITQDNNLMLKSTTSNAFAESKKYLLQIDTTALFNSNSLKETTITQEGGVVSWKPDVNWQNDQVYYWRTTADSSDIVGYNWNMQSFIHLDGVNTGWNQSHYFQFLEDDLEKIFIDSTDLKFKYVRDASNLDIEVTPYYDHGTYIDLNNQHIQVLWPGIPVDAIWVSVLDEVDLSLWQNPPGGLYNSVNNSATESYTVFPFHTNTLEERMHLMDFLQNDIPDGKYVLIASATFAGQDLDVEEWALDSVDIGTNLYQVFESQGAHLVRNFETQGFNNYAFFYKKNDPEYPVKEDYSDNIRFNFDLYKNWYEGVVKSPIIGPAKSWENVLWQLDDYDAATDNIDLKVIGIKSDKTESVLLADQQDFNIDLQSINAEDYPYIRLEYHSLDSVNRTLAGLDYWRVHFIEEPDLALNRQGHFVWNKDSIQQGEPLEFEIAVQNISPLDMDSTTISYIFTNEQNEVQTFTQPIPALTAGNSHNAQLTFDSRSLGGKIRMGVELNKENIPPESERLNNYSILEVQVDKDILNPLLDVTFDGKHIINGEIVSTQPEISVTLNDENQYLLLTDTSRIQISIKKPSDSGFTSLDAGDPALTFIPATSSQNNVAQLIYTPTFVEDGIYNLKAQGIDETGNISGDFNYEISFEVITQSSISSILNYPNPFTSTTQFVYTLTGGPQDIPDDYYIQILSVSGKIVKTITSDELGEIRIGLNKTDYAWDGTDDFGDRLANGVYLYRFVFKNLGEEKTTHYETTLDKYFKNGYGKLVILR